MSKGNEEGRAIPPEEQDGESADEKRLSRGKFITAAGVAGAGLVVGGAPAMAKSWSEGSRNKALTARQLAARHDRRPDGLQGRRSATSTRRTRRRAGRSSPRRRCARPERRPTRSSSRRSTSPGRSSRTSSRRAPTRRSPASGSGRPGSSSSSSRRTPPPSTQTNIRNASTKNGSFDLVTGAIEDTGDYAEAGLLRPLDDYVAQVPAELERPEVRLRRRAPDGRAVHAVQRPHVLGRVRQRHAAVRVPRATSSTTRRRRRRSRTSTASRCPCRRRGTTRRRSPSSSHRPDASTPLYGVGRAQVPVLGHRQLGAPLRLLG